MGTPLRVLIVEDSENDALLVAETLRNGGYDMTWKRVCTPDDMASALEGERWDAVIADHGMPNFSAPAALEELKKKGMDLPFIIVSGSIGEDIAVGAMKAGAHDYILKDNLTRLVPAIDRELHEAEIRRKHMRAEESIEISHRFLQIANRHAEMSPLLEEFVGGIREYTGCGAVGIRVFDKQGALSHRAYSGFPARFYEIECPLASEADRCRVCEAVLSGDTDPKLNIFSENGSFCINTPADFSPGAFADGGEAADNLCGRFGYQSIAIVPFRMWDRNVGLIHIADPSANMIPEGSVETLEQAAAILGTAVVRVETQQALGASEGKYRDLVENINDIIYTGDKNGTITYISPAIESFMGFTPEEAIGRSFGDFICLEDRSRFQAKIGEILSGSNEANEYRVVTKDGGTRWMRTSSKPIVEDGEVVGLRGILSDVDDRMRAEEALRDSELRYRTLVEQAKDIIFTLDPETWKISSANSYGLETLGFREEDVVGKMSMGDLVHPDDLEEAARILGERIEQNIRRPNFAFRLRKADGSYFDAEINAALVRDSEGRPESFIGIIRDVTQRKRAEEAVQRQKDLLESSIESLTHPFYVIDANNYTIRLANSAAGLGVLTADSKCYSLLHDSAEPCATDEHPCPLEQVKRTKKPFSAQHIHRDREGLPRHVEVHGYPISDKAGNVIQMIEYSLDVTDRHRAEEALKESEDRYRNLVENSLTGVYVRQGERFVFVNERLAQITGYSKKEMLETSFVEFIHPEDRSLALERAAGIEAGTLQAEPFEYRIITKRGDIRWIEAFGTKISYQGKSAVLANAADVTERKYAAEALRKSEEQYRLHFENMKDVIYTTDRNLLITSMSPSVEALLGYRPEEMVGRRVDELSVLATKEYERALSATSRLLAGEKVPPTEYEFIAKDGAVKVGEVSSSTMSKDGEVVTIINVARDITERKKAEAATRESEERYRSLFENTPIQIVVVDSDGVVTAANNARRASAGQPPKPGDRMYIDYASLHEHDMRAELMDCMVSGVPKEFPEQPYGKRVLWIRMSPFPGGAIIISEDISERKRGEEWLKRSHSLLSATLESTADGIMVVDMQGNMLSSNRRFVEMWKIPEYVIASRDDEQVRSFFLEQLKSPDEAIQEEDKVYADPEKERLDILEFKDGRIFERYTRPQKMGGKNVGIVFSFRDVTERRRAERALENSLSLLGATLESTADGILVVDMNGVNRNFNSRFLEIWNLTPEMMVSLDNSEVLTFRMNQLKDRERNIERTRLINSDPDREWMDVLEFSDGRVVERYSRPQKLGEKTVGKVLSYHDITERRRIEKSILESREQLRSLTSQLSLAEERERRRIANQLHDRVGQSLLASKMKLGTARESELPKALEEPLDEVYRLIEQTIRDVRSLTFELSPPILYMLGFEAAVEWLTEQAEKQYGIKCEFEDDGAVKPLDDDIRVLLFQNVRELLVNVCKHSQAQNAKVYVSLEDDAIRVSVEDNGVGFDASGVETHWDESSGFGLFSIRERLNQFGGGFEIDSEPGRGTRITLTAPLKAEDETTEGEQT